MLLYPLFVFMIRYNTTESSLESGQITINQCNSAIMTCSTEHFCYLLLVTVFPHKIPFIAAENQNKSDTVKCLWSYQSK